MNTQQAVAFIRITITFQLFLFLAFPMSLPESNSSAQSWVRYGRYHELSFQYHTVTSLFSSRTLRTHWGHGGADLRLSFSSLPGSQLGPWHVSRSGHIRAQEESCRESQAFLLHRVTWNINVLSRDRSSIVDDANGRSIFSVKGVMLEGGRVLTHLRRYLQVLDSHLWISM